MDTPGETITIDELSKIEGSASLTIELKNGNVDRCEFSITEMKRFFEEAMKGKDPSSVPQQVARVCGTCSNAHLLASVKALENALQIHPSPQTVTLRKLLNYALIIRDHALHLYVFSLPDLFQKNSILSFDMKNPEERTLVEDCFAVKHAGNQLAVLVAGRSVHAPFVRLGGFSKLPETTSLKQAIPLLNGVRAAVLRLIGLWHDAPFTLKQDLTFAALTDDEYSFLYGNVKTSTNQTLSADMYAKKITPVDIPYSQAQGYLLEGKLHMVGALARMNLNREALHDKTKQDARDALKVFPSTNIFHNNLAQAIEILHAIDRSVDLIGQYQALPETPIVPSTTGGQGIGVIEAPRGLLVHSVTVGPNGTVEKGEITVPTGQNQIGIEHAVKSYVENNLQESRETLKTNIEKIIRAYDPCMSCATHFLTLRWKDAPTDL